VRCIWRSHAITKLLSNPEVSDQMYTEIVGHVGNHEETLQQATEGK
jgi:hypothetical protein